MAAICQFCRENEIKPYFVYISTKRNPADPISRLNAIEKYLESRNLKYKEVK